MESIGSIISQARTAKGYTQQQLAGMAGVDYSYISKIEGNKTYPPKQPVICKIAQILGLDADQLIFLTGGSRFPEKYTEFVKENSKNLAALFAALQASPEFAQSIFNQLRESNDG